MATSLSELRKQKNSFDKLQKEVEKLTNKASYDDDRFWQPSVDQAGNGFCLIRFLPASRGEEFPWVRTWNHGFKSDAGKWFMEACPTTIGQNCPVCEENTKLWSSDSEASKKLASTRKRKLTYIANIMVISDSKNPQNEGKVFLFKFGSKIFDKIKDAMNPEFEDDTQLNPFDFWEGADFKLKIRKVEGYRNYDKSEFASQSPIAEDDDEIEAIWNKQYLLQDFVHPSKFKSYDELKKKFEQVISSTSSGSSAEEFDTPDESATQAPKASKPAPQKPAPKAPEPKVQMPVDDDDDEDYFRSLAAED